MFSHVQIKLVAMHITWEFKIDTSQQILSI